MILGIETSCDETSAAVLTDDLKILSNVILSQQEHLLYGGVVPELASRAQIRWVRAPMFPMVPQTPPSFHIICIDP